MRLRAKKLALRAVLVCFGICYTTVLVIWITQTTNGHISIASASDGHHSSHLNPEDTDFLSFQERVPRSVIDNKIDNEKSIQVSTHSNDNQNIAKESYQSSSHISNNANLVNSSDFNNHIDRLKEIHKNKFPITTLNDIFISVKTTKNFHSTRLDVILRTWFTLAKDQVNFLLNPIIFQTMDH